MNRTLKKTLFALSLVILTFFVLATMASAESYEVTENNRKLTFDSVSGIMTVEFVGNYADEGWWWEFQPTSGTAIAKFIATHKLNVTHMEIDYFKRIQFKDANSTLFKGMTNLVSVHFKAYSNGAGPDLYFNTGCGDLFYGCESLKTVWLGDNKTENVVDLSGLSCNSPFTANTFYNCSSMERLVLMENASITEISSTMFYGCEALKRVNIPSSVTSIADDAFATTALEAIDCEVGTAAYTFAVKNGYIPTLWSQKPTTAPVNSGYCLDANSAETNIKWELHNVGTAAAPSYNLYFLIDEAIASDNTWLQSNMQSTAAYGYATSNGAEKKHPWYDESTFGLIKNIVIGDGIQWLYGGCFVGMSSVETVEMPSSLDTMFFAPFKNMSSLTSVYTRGVNEKVEGTVNLSNVANVQMHSHYIFAGLSSVKQYIFNENAGVCAGSADLVYGSFQDNTSLVSLNIPFARIYNINGSAFLGCTSLRELTVTANVTGFAPDLSSCTALEAIYAPVGSAAHTYALANNYNSTNKILSADNVAYLEYYPADGSMTITDSGLVTGWHAFNVGDANVQAFMNAYKTKITSAVIGSGFGKVQNGGAGLFNGCTNLVSVNFPEGQFVCDYVAAGNFFKDCKSLTTVWFGDESKKTEGVADFSYMGSDYMKDVNKSLFEGCTSLKEVILPPCTTTNANDNRTLWASTFSGCTALEKITIPASYIGIEANAFAGCSSLRAIDYQADISFITKDAVNGAIGLVFYCDSAEKANTVNDNLAGAGVPTSTAFAFYQNGMDILGYSIRTKGYNGLRTQYSFNANAVSGYELVEFGSIVASEDNWNKYSESFGNAKSILSLSGNELVTPAENIVKTPIYQNGGYVNNSVEGENGREFSVTIVKFNGEAQIKSEIVSVGYEVWKRGENYYVLFTRENADEYETISLYKTTMGMLADGVVEVSMDEEKDPIWSTLNMCTKTSLAIADEGITAYTFADPHNSDKVIAVYLTANSSETTLTDLGLTYEEKANVSAFIYGKNVNCAIPVLDSYWEEYIEEKLASVPDGKSFIVYTDTHFEIAPESLGSNQVSIDPLSNTSKVTDLIQYVRARTGIKTVANLGDPYSGEERISDAEKIFKLSVEDYFYDKFGEDGLFVVGNHDANHSMWLAKERSSTDPKVEGQDGEGAYNYLIKDSLIYDSTVKNIEKKDGVVFDNAMLALADKLTYSDIYYEDSVTGTSYTAAQMKEEFIAWAKLHYYYDDEEAGIRYIVYNSGNCGLTEVYTLGNNLWNNIIPTQLDFIANALATTPEGYDIMFLGHMLADADTSFGAQYNLYQLLCAFKGGASVELAGLKNANENMNMIISGTKEGIETKIYDFTENGAFEGAIMTFCGHWHQDFSHSWANAYGTGSSWPYNVEYDGSVAKSDRTIYLAAIENDGFHSDKVGTTNENGFAVVTITPEGNVVVTGFGVVDSRTYYYH